MKSFKLKIDEDIEKELLNEIISKTANLLLCSNTSVSYILDKDKFLNTTANNDDIIIIEKMVFDITKSICKNLEKDISKVHIEFKELHQVNKNYFKCMEILST